MPPAKKNKKPKMTKAERKAMRALQKKLALIQMNKDKMDREHKMTMANLPKVMDKHYPIMKKGTISRMREDIKAMEQISKRIFDLKKHTIETLQEDIESAEAQYMRQTRAHLSHLDQLIEIMQARIKSLSEIYEIERQHRFEHGKKTMDQLKNTFEYEEERWKVTIHLKAKEHQEKEADAAGEFFLKFEDMIDRLQTQHDKMEGHFDSGLLKMWQSMQNYFQEYQNQIFARRQAYDKLLRMDMENSACIKYQAHWIQSMTNQIQILKDKLQNCENEYKKEIGDLKAEREEYITVYKSHGSGMKHGKTGDSSMLKDLVICCHDAENKLQKTKNKADRILTLAQMCRALETEEEKVMLPLTFSSDEGNRITGLKAKMTDLYINKKIQADRDRRGAKKSEGEQFLADMEYLQCFWARVGRANMLRGELRLKKQILTRENEMLKDKLREFLLMQGRQNYCKCEIDQLISIQMPTHD